MFSFTTSNHLDLEFYRSEIIEKPGWVHQRQEIEILLKFTQVAQNFWSFLEIVLIPDSIAIIFIHCKFCWQLCQQKEEIDLIYLFTKIKLPGKNFWDTYNSS